MDIEQMASLLPALKAFLQRFRACFRRERTFGYLARYVGGLMADLDRKSIEPIALAMDVPVRTLQEFLSMFVWDDERLDDALQRLVADEHGSVRAVGILDSSGHPKQGDKTPGVQHQYCGERGKQENCVVGQHLLYTDGHVTNPFSCMLDSRLYVPRKWLEDPERCQEAGIPVATPFRTKWQIGLDQIRRAVGNGIRFSYFVFDADYGKVPAFWFALDEMGQRGVGFAPPDLACWTRLPACRSSRAEHGSKRADTLVTHSDAFRRQPWRRLTVKTTTRGESVWTYKATRVHLVAQRIKSRHRPSIPTDRQYWLIAADNCHTGERQYVVSNDTADADPASLLRVALERWHVEKWFERAKQQCGLGAFEVRTYRSLLRHWLCSRLAMLFLARQTQRLRGEKSGHHVRAGRRRGPHAAGQVVEPLAQQLVEHTRPMPILSATQ